MHRVRHEAADEERVRRHKQHVNRGRDPCVLPSRRGEMVLVVVVLLLLKQARIEGVLERERGKHASRERLWDAHLRKEEREENEEDGTHYLVTESSSSPPPPPMVVQPVNGVVANALPTQRLL